MMTIEESVPLSGGFSNGVFLQNGMVVKEYWEGKIDPVDDRREREHQALLLFGGTIAPAFLGMADGRLYQEYLKGINLQEALLNNTIADCSLALVGQILAHIHRPSPLTRDIEAEFKEKVSHTLPRAAPLLEKLDISLSQVRDRLQFDWDRVKDAGITFTHGDYHLANIMTTENGIKVIDWENSGYDTPYVDLARIEALSLSRYQLNRDEFYVGYGRKPDQPALNGFIMKHLLHHAGKIATNNYHDENFNQHIINLLRQLTE